MVHYQVATLLGKAYALFAITEIAVSKDWNIRSVFRDDDFATKNTEVNSSLGVQKEHSTSFFVPSDITPILHFRSPAHREPRLPAKGSACLVTGSPHKQKLLRCTEKQSHIVVRKTCRRQTTATIKSHKGRKIHESSSRNGNEGEVLSISMDEENSDDDAQCPYCDELFGRQEGREMCALHQVFLLV
jgi:hypothetical protein